MLKKKFPITLTMVFLSAIGIFYIYNSSLIKDDIDLLRQSHAEALQKSSFRDHARLNKKQRYNLGLPPNPYYEQQWQLTLDPSTGRPMPERLIEIKKKSLNKRQNLRGVGDSDNPWIDRGPNNVGGRTRGILFDPNDINNMDSNDDFTRVFAGSVSGGLWVNEDITDAQSSWSLIEGMDGSIAVNAIVSDPNNPQVMYIGSGESYTSGQAIGNGIWKSTDGGATWENIFGGYDGFFIDTVLGIFYVNDIVARDNAGQTEIYAAIAPAVYRYANSPRNAMGYQSYGVYRSVDEGVTWQRLNITNNSGTYKNPNDLEIDANNNIWLTTTRNIDLSLGGEIYKSEDGQNFQLINEIPNAARTELEISSNNPDLMWVLADVNGEADLFRSEDGFTTFTAINEPNDPDTDIPATDFTRGQAFYDLMIEADEADNLYVGGIDLFRSTDLGDSWNLISKWAQTSGLTNKRVSLVHADQHSMAFRPNDANQAIFGNDGGVYYSTSLRSAAFLDDAILPRIKDYNTIQFYSGSIDVTRENEDNIAGGSQDNGTLLVQQAVEGANGFTDFFRGGDGGFTELANDYMIQSYPFNFHSYADYPDLTEAYRITTYQTDDNFNGNFINEGALDKNLDVFYANASNNNLTRIERVSNFKDGESNIVNEFLSNTLMNSSPSALTISPFTTESTSLYVGTRNGRLLKVLNANDAPAWSNITGSEFIGSISDIEFGATEDQIFVTIHNYGVENIWYSDDAGANWRSLDGNLPDLPVKCMLQNPLNRKELIIGTELGVWFTDDFTEDEPQWNQSYNGMSDVTVVDLDLRPSDNLVLASTHGRGMFTSQFTAESLSTTDDDLNRFLIYPTISSGKFYLKSNVLSDDANIAIYDISGKMVKKLQKSLTDADVLLNFNQSTGIYFVNITVDNYSETKRIVINN